MTLDRPPLVEPVSGHDAPATTEGGPERRLGGQGLGPGVDHPVADPRVLRPGGHQPPAHRCHGANPVSFVDGEHIAGGCDVPVRRGGIKGDRIRHRPDLEVARQLIGRGRRHESPTHRSATLPVRAQSKAPWRPAPDANRPAPAMVSPEAITSRPATVSAANASASVIDHWSSSEARSARRHRGGNPARGGPGPHWQRARRPGRPGG